ncbi:MAG TPA: hypothetical protein VMY88_07025, partial [Acidimicrobiales bacterium]|nr:hypothetical protein [Acidimicrobiales bacterium]
MSRDRAAPRVRDSYLVALDSVVSLLGRFLSWTKKHKSEATYTQRRHFLRSFIKSPGVRKTQPHHITVELVEAWLDGHPKWKAS